MPTASWTCSWLVSTVAFHSSSKPTDPTRRRRWRESRSCSWHWRSLSAVALESKRGVRLTEPPNFSRVALATAFSPRFLPGLAEAWHFAARFQAAFSIIHVGLRNIEKETILAEAMEHLAIPLETPMF